MLNVQATKDTFYSMLQSRIAALNPARTIVLRGVLRPGVLVPENELPGAAVDGISPAETFCIRWTGLKIDAQSAGPMLTLSCEIRYASDGTPGNASMDRGRTLAAMDAELATALTTWPLNHAAETFAEIRGGGACTSMPLASTIFWSEASFAPVVSRGERLERIAHLEVFGYGQ